MAHAKKKLPIGVVPRYIYDESGGGSPRQRVLDLSAAIHRYEVAGALPRPEWRQELAEIRASTGEASR